MKGNFNRKFIGIRILKSETAMKLKERARYHIFPHITVSVWLGFFFLIVFILGLMLLYQSREYIPNAALFAYIIIYPIVYIIMALVLNVFFWNAVVTVDEAGMRQRRGWRILTWTWEELCNVKARTERAYPWRTSAGSIFAPKFSFVSSKKKEKLVIVMEKYARNVIFKMCKNEKIKDDCAQLLESCNFSYI